jgi:pimeloyl-ACP methyl ester carboxylesterase
VLVLALTVSSFAYNAATSGRERPAAALYPGPFVRVAGRLVAYRRWGSSGSPIVLVGGFAEASWIWRKVGSILGRRHRVVALDLPPFGYSERSGHYTLRAWIELVTSFDRRLGIDRPLLVGHSLGAAVAVGEALDHPRDVSAIVLLDGDALSAGRRVRWLADLLVDPYYTSVYRIVTGADWIVRRAVRGAYGKHPALLDHESLHDWERPFRVRGTAAAFRKLLRYGIQGFRLSDLLRVAVPRTVVWGTQDTVDSVSAGRRTAAELRAPFVTIPDAGHLSMLGNPRAVARALERAAAPAR